MEERKCPQCGAAIAPDATECKYCGEKLPSAVSAHAQPSANGASDKSKLTAGLLAIFLGSLGIHKFYLGYKKEAITMLVICLAGSLLFGAGAAAMSVIGLIEGILYLTKSDDEFTTTYLQGHKGWF